MAKVGDQIQAYGGQSRYVVTSVDAAGNPIAFDYIGKGGKRRPANPAATKEAKVFYTDRGVIGAESWEQKKERQLASATKQLESTKRLMEAEPKGPTFPSPTPVESRGRQPALSLEAQADQQPRDKLHTAEGTETKHGERVTEDWREAIRQLQEWGAEAAVEAEAKAKTKPIEAPKAEWWQKSLGKMAMEKKREMEDPKRTIMGRTQEQLKAHEAHRKEVPEGYSQIRDDPRRKQHRQKLADELGRLDALDLDPTELRKAKDAALDWNRQQQKDLDKQIPMPKFAAPAKKAKPTEPVEVPPPALTKEDQEREKELEAARELGAKDIAEQKKKAFKEKEVLLTEEPDEDGGEESSIALGQGFASLLGATAPKAEAPAKAEAPKAEAPKAEATPAKAAAKPKPEVPTISTQTIAPGVTIPYMAPKDRGRQTGQDLVDKSGKGKAVLDFARSLIPTTPRGQMLGLSAFGFLMEGARYVAEQRGPAQAYATKTIAELEAKERRGELGRDRALEQEEMGEMMRPVRAIAAEGRRQAEAVQAGMGETRSAAALGRVRREQAQAIGEAARQAGGVVSARRAQRAAQELQKLESLYAYKQESLENAIGRAFKGVGATMQQIGRIAAASAEMEHLTPEVAIAELRKLMPHLDTGEAKDDEKLMDIYLKIIGIAAQADIAKRKKQPGAYMDLLGLGG